MGRPEISARSAEPEDLGIQKPIMCRGSGGSPQAKFCYKFIKSLHFSAFLEQKEYFANEASYAHYYTPASSTGRIISHDSTGSSETNKYTRNC